MKYISIYFCLFLLISTCKNTGNKIIVKPIKALSVIDTFKENGKIKSINKLDSYKVIGYSYDKSTLAFIDSFIRKNKDPHINKYTQYNILVYEAVNETGMGDLKQHPDRYYNQDNTIYQYTWMKGSFLSRDLFKNGKIIEQYDYTGKISPATKVTIKDATTTIDSSKH